MKHLAEQFFEEHWNDTKHSIHNKAVIQVCLGMIESTTLNPEVFIIAGWVHDLGKLRDKDNHHIESIHFLNLFIGENPKYQKDYDTIKDCIINHRTSGNPSTLSGRIFQIADKAALKNKEWIEYTHK